jgi:hypothetical protein
LARCRADRNDAIFPYERECDGSLGSNHDAARLFGVESVDSYDIFSKETGDYFSIWLDAASSVRDDVFAFNIPTPALVTRVLSSDEWSKFLIPQMVLRHLGPREEAQSWSLDGYLIGVA